MSESILTSTKKILGVDESFKEFDLDIATHINSALFTLRQLGVGPSSGFLVEDETSKWNQFVDDPNTLNGVKSYVYLKARLLFDPPGTPHHLKAMQDQAIEMEHRLKLEREAMPWATP